MAARYAGGEMMEKVLENRGELEFSEQNCDDYNILNSAVECDNQDSLLVILKWITKLKEENGSIGKKVPS